MGTDQESVPDPPRSPKGRRPPVTARACLEGVIFVLTNGCRWKALSLWTGPEQYPSPATRWRRHRDWTESGVWKIAWQRLLNHLDKRGRINWSEAMGEGTFSPAKSRDSTLARPNEPKGPSCCCWWTDMDFRCPHSPHQPINLANQFVVGAACEQKEQRLDESSHRDKLHA
ncbi:transposase [Thalassoglobus neptunius]|uniref:transposase n=1 Tax=Thalassoglobus neptunius TaxID=1938619 RepID=UPI0011B44AB6|nr:transposase [Thalassoglobus neptunius]